MIKMLKDLIYLLVSIGFSHLLYNFSMRIGTTEDFMITLLAYVLFITIKFQSEKADKEKNKKEEI